jgi:hypothetical protein
MNIYEKLNTTRVELQKVEVSKSGSNKFAGYTYYELGDFLPKINELFEKNKLIGIVSFSEQMATLKIVNTEKISEFIEFNSPMRSAELKGCHPIQNLGAVETYQRRYLYMTALEIVEHDALDATTQPPQEDARPWLTEEQFKAMMRVAEGGDTNRVRERMKNYKINRTYRSQLEVSLDGKVH